MPHRNRVAPDGDLIAVPDRGTLMGNRGVLHDRDGRIVRRAVGRRWISCLLAFRDRHRQVLAPGRYTHLFFLDEATALAAGHRPCAECRRPDHLAFRRAWALAHDLAAPPGVDTMDDVLHRQRALVDGRRSTWPAVAADLPDGTVVAPDGGWWLVAAGRLHRWSPGGYLEHRPMPAGDLPVLTPPAVVAVLAAGYRPLLHPSAVGAAS